MTESRRLCYLCLPRNYGMQKLKDNVWERKTKWSLLEQADFHYRHKLLRKSINSWVAYLSERYKKKINRRLAEMHYEAKLKWKVILLLRRNVGQCWMLMRMCRKSFEWNLKYKSWHQWKHYVEKRLKVREVKALADRIREERIRIRFFYLWVSRLREKQSLEHAYEEAVKKYDFRLKEKHFKSWKVFTERLICKVKIEKLAKACYEDKLKERFFRCWMRHAHQRRRYKYQMKLIRNFYESYLLRNYIGLWLSACKQMRVKRKIYNFNLAVSFHNRRALEKSFRALWRARERRRSLEEKTEKFREEYVRIYLDLWMEKRMEKIVWNHLEVRARQWREDYLIETFLWSLWERHRDRLEEREEMACALKYYNAIIVHKTFNGWREVAIMSIKKKACLESAYKTHLERLKKKKFEKWKKFVKMRSRKKMAVEYYRLTILSKIMEGWKVLSAERKVKLARAKNLERKRSLLILKQAFESWYNETRSSKSKLASAIYFCDRIKLSRGFSAWKNITRGKSVNRSRYNRGRAHLGDVVVKSMIFRWHEMLGVKQNLKRKLQELRSKQEKRLVALHFGIWQRFVDQMKVLQQSRDAYPQLRANILMEQYLGILFSAMQDKKVLNQKEELAKVTEVKLLKRRYLRKWVAFLCWKRERILKCLAEERKPEPREDFEVFIPVGDGKRRQPMIPNYLKAHVHFGQLEGNLLFA